MDVNAGKLTFVKASQPPNAPSPIDSVAGKLTLVRAMQS